MSLVGFEDHSARVTLDQLLNLCDVEMRSGMTRLKVQEKGLSED